MSDTMIEHMCLGGFGFMWLGFFAWWLHSFVTFGAHRVAHATILHEAVSFRTASSRPRWKTDVAILRTVRPTAPITVALVQRVPTSVGGSGAHLTREQAQAVARWLREAAAQPCP